ncbi:MAG: F0F1 ATP synthase subunit gamma [Pseudomonadota bacterium]|nr:F0F1 ATP synthase subunit gamma [Pseudomonadota bacterium]
MTRRRDVQERISHLEEIREILNSMKTLSYMQTRKLTRRIENQRRMVGAIEEAAADFLAFHPDVLTAADLPPVCILVGTERGFCGDLNEKVLHHVGARVGVGETPAPALIAVGYRLGSKLGNDTRLAATIEGADTAEEVDRVLERIVDALERLRNQHGPMSLEAIYLNQETEQVTEKSLLPPFRELARSPPRFIASPLLQLEPHDFLVRLVDQYLLAAVQEILYTSLMTESRRRVQHLEGALRHLDKRLESLERKGRQLRQEEIIEEIEVILLGASESPHGGARTSLSSDP